MLTYNEPNTYKLTPVDYKYCSELIVEIWGAGGGGSTDGINGGGGGSYIKASVKTDNKTFTIEVGKGGLQNAIGGNSSFCTDNDDVKLIAGGGQDAGKAHFGYQGIIGGGSKLDNGGKVISILGAMVHENINGYGSRQSEVQALPTNCASTQYSVRDGKGGSGAKGGNGGLNHHDSIHDSLKRFNNGEFPGGGGSANCLDLLNRCWAPNPKKEAGKGANGRVIIYLIIDDSTNRLIQLTNKINQLEAEIDLKKNAEVNGTNCQIVHKIPSAIPTNQTIHSIPIITNSAIPIDQIIRTRALLATKTDQTNTFSYVPLKKMYDESPNITPIAEKRECSIMITLINHTTILSINVLSLYRLFENVGTLFGYQYEDLSLYHNDVILDNTKSFEYYGISNGSIIIVTGTSKLSNRGDSDGGGDGGFDIFG